MKEFLPSRSLLEEAAAPAAGRGDLCLTFDDRYFDSWIKADEIFKKYDARVTFFVCGRIDQEALTALERLQAAGHTIGLHGLNHAKTVSYAEENGLTAYTENEILPQLEICRKNDMDIRAFAYPYSQRNADTDNELFRTFDFLRTNCTAVKTAEEPLDKADGCFVKSIRKKQVFHGFPASGNFGIDEVQTAMRRAAGEDSTLLFYAHDITENPNKSHHISRSQLVQILEYAKLLKMRVCGLNEL